MAKYILILMVLLGPLEFPQHYYTFSELKGLNDSLNNTHLFYRLFWSHSVDSLMEYSFENSMYHYDLSTDIDSLFIPEFGSGNIYSNYAVYLMDLEFWNNDPTKYIYSGSEVGMDPIGFVTRFDDLAEKIYIPSFGEFQIDISKQNDSVIYTGLSNLQSVDSGYNWITKDWDVGFLSLSPFNDQEIFAYGYPGLYKSTNAGNDFQVIDTTNITNFLQPQFFYDADQNHIYRVFQSYPNYILSVSDNNGNAFSWTTKYSSLSKIFLSINPAQSGELFLADGKYIFRSDNYGETFNLYRSLDRDVVGIYKEPNSQNLYATTKYKIYEITNDSLIVLKSLAVDPDLFNWHPITVGDKWIYKVTYWSIPDYDEGILIRTVVGTEVLPNGKEYFKIEEKYVSNSYTQIIYERIDSSDGLVYEFDESCPDLNNERMIDDLLASAGDSILIKYDCFVPVKTFFEIEDNFQIWGINLMLRKFSMYSLISYNYDMLKNIGLYSLIKGFDFGSYTYVLNGCIINGIVYGDTTVTDVKEDQTIPKEFALYQNYPNPFNPSTTINYDLPVNSRVTLKIFDILGREIKTLIDEFQQTGDHQINFQSTPDMPSGVYFYQLVSEKFIKTMKMIILK